jgi:hypothetical protein
MPQQKALNDVVRNAAATGKPYAVFDACQQIVKTELRGKHGDGKNGHELGNLASGALYRIYLNCLNLHPEVAHPAVGGKQ